VWLRFGFPASAAALTALVGTLPRTWTVPGPTAFFSLLLVLVTGAGAQVVCDADTDCFYVPESLASGRPPALVVLSCNGALKADLDSFRFVADSLGWIMASCHRTRNHRDMMLNDADVVRTIHKLLLKYPVDSSRVYVFGFSGQAVQALATMFLHPDLVRGVAATCGHEGASELAVWEELAGHQAYLITREKDWNRRSNEQMAAAFREQGIASTLVMTPGEHGPGPRQELLDACRWLRDTFRP
jgi:predicted esterase